MRSYTFKEVRESLLFVAPLLIFVAVFVIVPVLGTLVNSTFRDVAFLERQFVWFDNYLWLMGDPGFWQATRFTLLFVLVSVPFEMTLGLLFAVILNEPTFARGLIRACVLIPWAIPAAISARVWELIYNYEYGLANFIWTSFGGDPVHWLGTEVGAFFALVITDAWKTTPFVAAILLAGISIIPTDLYRQAQIDGANMFQRFVRITLPLLKPALVVALIFRTIDALRIFDIIYVLTRGGPGGTTTSVSLHGYKYFLLSDFGYGSAVSVVLFLIALALSIICVRVTQFGEGMK
jgi:multiple sugar transport system permease protein